LTEYTPKAGENPEVIFPIRGSQEGERGRRGEREKGRLIRKFSSHTFSKLL
jgi:hypothetical protein